MEVVQKQTDQVIKFLSLTQGRDRLNRFFQFFLKFLAYRFQLSSPEEKLNLIKRLNKISSSIAQSRKLMRIGRPLEYLKTIQKNWNVKDDVTRLTNIGKNIGLAIWLTFDAIVWANSVGVFELSKETAEKVSSRANKSWLMALLLSLIGSLHKLRLNLIRTEIETKIAKDSKKKGEEDTICKKNLASLNSERNSVFYTLAQESMDILIPASSLNWIALQPGNAALFASISSIMGGWTVWKSL